MGVKLGSFTPFLDNIGVYTSIKPKFEKKNLIFSINLLNKNIFFFN